MTDKLTDCPICLQKGAVYTTAINEFHNYYLCLGCGFTTNDLMRVDEFDFEEYEKELPHLYVDSKKQDEEGRVWYPNVVNIQDKGTVFLNGTCKEDSKWSAIKNVKLTKQEKQDPRFKGKSHKSDSETLVDFGNDYLSALEYIGINFI
jgi:hypothetical protein